jgi:hypothetical protein
MGGEENAYRVWWGKNGGKRPFGRPRIREDNVKINLKQIHDRE